MLKDNILLSVTQLSKQMKKPCYVPPDRVPLKAELSVIDGAPVKDTTIIMLLHV